MNAQAELNTAFDQTNRAGASPRHVVGHRFESRGPYALETRTRPADALDRCAAPALHSPTTPIVFVVDGDITVRNSLELLICGAGWRAKTFACAEEFLANARVSAPSCLVLDLALPGLSGLELQKRIAVERTDMPIIFIAGCADVPVTVQAMKAGACEFFVKPLCHDTLMSAIEAAMARSQTALREEAAGRALRDCYASLSRREREVMALVVTGLLNKQVGSELGITEITVKAHRGNVMRKMNARSLATLVTMAAGLGAMRPRIDVGVP